MSTPGPNIRRLMWVFLVANIAFAIIHAFTGQITLGIVNSTSACVLAIALAYVYDERKAKR